MGNFNFYINVDQCLNMSNFDMFFYKLQSERQFHLSNVQFFDDQGENSLKNAFHEIRIYMDKAPFLIQDYRLIFGMREDRQAERTWTNSILYRLLKIYYGLRDAKLFIKSKDAADKNVSVIILYDTDFTLEMPPLKEYNLSEDIVLLMDAVGVDYLHVTGDYDICARIQDYLLKHKAESDDITRRFLEGYVEWFRRADSESDEKYNLIKADMQEMGDTMEGLDYDDNEENIRKKKAANVDNTLHLLTAFAESCVCHYCVFRKEIDRNSLAQNLLALLSLVDYITSDLKPLNEGEKIKTNANLKEQSRRNWEISNNDDGIQRRYGEMIANYKSTLQTALANMQRRITEFTEGIPAPDYKPPAKLSGEVGICPQEECIYKGEFEDILNHFMKNSIKKESAVQSWSSTYRELREKLVKMETDLYLYADDLSKKYKEQLESRRIDSMKQEDSLVYSQDDISDKYAVQNRKRELILDSLKKPQMNPSLKFQDQLNMENALEKCNQDVTFFAGCQKMIKSVNFFLLILVSIGTIGAHYLIMQSYVFSDVEMLSAFFMYLAAMGLFFLLCWNAPYYFFKRKISHCISELKKEMNTYIRGYFQKAENFKEYINSINELDAVTSYMERLSRIKEVSAMNSRKYLWHKVQIQEHIRKSSYFENLIYSIDGIDQENDYECKLDVKKDVIHNKLYWPQKK